MRADDFRDVMAEVCAPVTIVTTSVGQQPHGATVSAIASLSLDPPMISVALDERSNLLRAVRDSGRFGVHVLRAGQQDLATRFARSGIDRFAGIGWEFDHGLPKFAGAGTWIVCELTDTVAGGDHLLLGHVRRFSRRRRTRSPETRYSTRRSNDHSGREGDVGTVGHRRRRAGP